MFRVLVLVLFAAAFAHASEVIAEDERAQAVLEEFAKRLPQIAVDEIRPTPVDGLYELTIGASVVYVTDDGRFLLSGELIDLRAGTNLSDARKSEIRGDMLARMSDDDMIVFAPETGTIKHTITVFTDIDCPYCRRLHEEVPELNDNGVAVRYLLFPRAGVGSQSYRTSVSVWCAGDRQSALTAAKAGRSVEQQRCNNPVESHLEIGRELGVSGTPYMVLDNGAVIPGYQAADQLLARLQQG